MSGDGIADEARSMKETWARDRPAVALGPEEATLLLQKAFPRARVTDCEVLTGGLANSNLKLRIEGGPGPLVLRLYQHDPGQARKEAAISALLAGKVPVPRYRYVGEDGPREGGTFALLDWVEGRSLAAAWPDMTDQDFARMGMELGQILAVIHGFAFAQPGFLDGNLAVGQTVDIGGAGLRAYIRDCLQSGPLAETLGEALSEALVGFVERDGSLLDQWSRRPSLTHSDFNPENILVRQTSRGWDVATVLDWEFAFSGGPVFDLGNLLRPPFGHRPGAAEAVASGYRSLDPSLPDDWRRMSLLADLTAWAEMLSRPSCPHERAEHGRKVIAETIAGKAL